MSSSAPSENPYNGLEALMEKDCQGELPQLPLIFLHPHKYGSTHVSPGLREYEEKELEALDIRDFETRMFFTHKTFEGDSVWLRTHWTDNHIHKTPFNCVRDYFKAIHATKNHTAAKSVLSEIFTMCLAMEKSNYYSFAITMASAFSEMGKNLSFQIHAGMIKSLAHLPLARRKLCLAMHLIFTKIKTANFLYFGKPSNIYRLVHCKTVVSDKGKRYLLVPFFSFFLQLLLTVFVIFAVKSDNEPTSRGGGGGGGDLSTEPSNEKVNCELSMTFQFSGESDCDMRKIGNFLLALITFVYSSILAWPGLTETFVAYQMYGKVGPIQMLDFVANSIIPIVLIISGFVIILRSEKFMDAVLNTAALLFIPEIDDQLPGLLGYNQEIIVKNYLVYKLLLQYDHCCMMPDSAFNETMIKNVDESIGIQFCDYYLTHWPEQGSSHEECIHFQPHEVSAGQIGGKYGHQINPVNSVNENCLIRKIRWSYTTGFESSIKPRIAYLRLDMMNGEPVEIDIKGVDNEVGTDDDYYELEGAFIITAFQMSNAVLRLRVCGSYDPGDFIKALDYYSLWELSPAAERLLLQQFCVEEMIAATIQGYKNSIFMRRNNPFYTSLSRASFIPQQSNSSGGFRSSKFPNRRFTS